MVRFACRKDEDAETIRCRLYLAALAEEQECTFWVHLTVSIYRGGDSLDHLRHWGEIKG